MTRTNVLYAGKEYRVLQDEVPVQLFVGSGAVQNAQRNNGVPTKCLLEDSLQINERAAVGEVGKAIWSKDCVELGVYPPQDIWLEGEAQQSTLGCRGGGLQVTNVSTGDILRLR